MRLGCEIKSCAGTLGAAEWISPEPAPRTVDGPSVGKRCDAKLLPLEDGFYLGPLLGALKSPGIFQSMHGALDCTLDNVCSRTAGIIVLGSVGIGSQKFLKLIHKQSGRPKWIHTVCCSFQ